MKGNMLNVHESKNSSNNNLQFCFYFFSLTSRFTIPGLQYSDSETKNIFAENSMNKSMRSHVLS